MELDIRCVASQRERVFSATIARVGGMTPTTLHHSQAIEAHAARARVLEAAYGAPPGALRPAASITRYRALHGSSRRSERRCLLGK